MLEGKYKYISTLYDVYEYLNIHLLNFKILFLDLLRFAFKKTYTVYFIVNDDKKFCYSYW